MKKERELVYISDKAMGAAARRLVVLIPGMGSNKDAWASFIQRLQQEPGYGPTEAQWMSFEHGIRPWTLGEKRPEYVDTIDLPSNLEMLARQLRNQIHQHWLAHKMYQDVVLIGHSFGGLLARRVYLLAAGAVPYENGSPWGEQISRIVLFASVNRGFRLERLKPQFSLIANLGRLFARRVFFFEDVLQGSDFVTNLRIDWIRHFRTLENLHPDDMKRGESGQVHGPLVVQYLGDRDELIQSSMDDKDILAFPTGHFHFVAGANHANLFRLEPTYTTEPDARYAVLRQAFVEEPASMETNPERRPQKTDKKRVVMILHGIRADRVDDWVERLRKQIRERDSHDTAVSTPTYGYFTAYRFALPPERRKNIPIFRDEYTELLAEHPQAEFSIIAHSNGTYMLGRSLRKTPGMRFKNVVLAGSALPEEYDWEQLMNPDGNVRQVGRVRNERANRDAPIGLLCSMLQGLPGKSMKDIGRGGFAGFRGDAVLEIAYHEGGHGKALEEANLPRLVDYVFDRDPQELSLPKNPGYFFGLSNFFHHIGLVLLVGLLALIVWIPFIGGGFHPWTALIVGVVLVLILLILNSA
jgi:pimeloyl-ACP methyl ester carboxylesterase